MNLYSKENLFIIREKKHSKASHYRQDEDNNLICSYQKNNESFFCLSNNLGHLRPGIRLLENYITFNKEIVIKLVKKRNFL